MADHATYTIEQIVTQGFCMGCGLCQAVARAGKRAPLS